MLPADFDEVEDRQEESCLEQGTSEVAANNGTDLTPSSAPPGPSKIS